MPEYVKCIKSNTKKAFTVGKIYNWPNPIDNEGDKRDIDCLEGCIWTFIPSTKAEYDAQFIPKSQYLIYNTVDTEGTLDIEFTGRVTNVSIDDKKVKINYQVK